MVSSSSTLFHFTKTAFAHHETPPSWLPSFQTPSPLSQYKFFHRNSPLASFRFGQLSSSSKSRPPTSSPLQLVLEGASI